MTVLILNVSDLRIYHDNFPTDGIEVALTITIHCDSFLLRGGKVAKEGTPFPLLAKPTKRAGEFPPDE